MSSKSNDNYKTVENLKVENTLKVDLIKSDRLVIEATTCGCDEKTKVLINGSLRVKDNVKIRGNLRVNGTSRLCDLQTQVINPCIPGTPIVINGSSRLCTLFNTDRFPCGGNTVFDHAQVASGVTLLGQRPLGVFKADGLLSSNMDVVIAPTGSGALRDSLTGNPRGINAVDLQIARDDPANVASGDYSVIGGGRNNQATGSRSTVGGGGSEFFNAGNTASGIISTVGGGRANLAGEVGSTVSGGNINTATGIYSSIGGGIFNNASGDFSTVAGGIANSATGSLSFIGGGSDNVASGNSYATIGGGQENTASANYTTIGGGALNTAGQAQSTIAGGVFNTTSGVAIDGTIGGGSNNFVNNLGGTIAGGVLNSVSGTDSFIGGGAFNSIDLSASLAVIGGGVRNVVTEAESVIGGGNGNSNGGFQSVIGGGANNSIAAGTFNNCIPGGVNATIAALNTGCFVFNTATPISTTNFGQAIFNLVGGAFPHVAPNTFYINGNLSVTGAKAFLAPHPVLPNKSLRHFCTEAPRADLIYRGRVQLQNGRAEIDIDTASNITPGTFAALTIDPHVHITNDVNFDLIRVENQGTVPTGKFSIVSNNPQSNAVVVWLVVAKRIGFDGPIEEDFIPNPVVSLKAAENIAELIQNSHLDTRKMNALRKREISQK